MIKRLFRFGLLVGLLGGLALALVKVFARDDKPTVLPAPGGGPAADPAPWPRLEGDPAVPAPGVAAASGRDAAPEPTEQQAAPPRAWVEPDGDVCPTSHPVKVKLASRIFHVPGGVSYGRTRPDRCYTDATAAEADGLRPAKR